ncbi:integrase core domain-containing protein [Desulfovibrio desulfuricans]|uniref:integrase core domain-containing protein n=1 Tax=Desulfovibrio desulfuricans TaxID=876 RepID=UPI0009DC02D8
MQIEFTRHGTSTNNGHVENFNGKLRDECLNQNVFFSCMMPRERLRLGGRITKPTAIASSLG